METNKLKKVLKSGISPLELKYSTIKSTNGSEIVGYRSFVQINSLDLGPLLPEHYREVANRNALGNRLSVWGLNKVCRDIINLEMYSARYLFVTVYIPVKMLLTGACYQQLKKYFEKSEFAYIDKLCIEFSSDILFYEFKDVIDRINEIKSLGIKVAISDFGDEFCPVNRLKGLPFDIVFFAKSIGSAFLDEEKNADAIIKMCADLGYMCTLVADINLEQISRAYYLDCNNYQMLALQTINEAAKIGGDSDE